MISNAQIKLEYKKSTHTYKTINYEDTSLLLLPDNITQTATMANNFTWSSMHFIFISTCKLVHISHISVFFISFSLSLVVCHMTLVLQCT